MHHRRVSRRPRTLTFSMTRHVDAVSKALATRGCFLTIARMSGTLFVTLRRGTAGKTKDHLKTLVGLGLRRPRDVRALPNNSGTRGAIEKVKHLVRVETLESVEERLRVAHEHRALREPIDVKH
jgi:large subunit ribosomal protein L30